MISIIKKRKPIYKNTRTHLSLILTMLRDREGVSFSFLFKQFVRFFISEFQSIFIEKYCSLSNTMRYLSY